MKRFFYILSVIVLFAPSCRKKETATPAAPVVKTNREMVMNGQWQVTKMETTVIMYWGDTVTWDITSSSMPCSRDHKNVFHSSGFKIIDARANPCYSGQVFDTLKRWSMPNEHQIIETDIEGGYDIVWTIDSISDRVLIMSEGIVDSGTHKNTVYHASYH